MYHIVVKDQNIFEETSVAIQYACLLSLPRQVLDVIFLRVNQVFFGKGLLGSLGAYPITNSHRVHSNAYARIAGESHRRQRKLLNPVFSIKHMRHMMPIFYDICEQVCPLFL